MAEIIDLFSICCVLIFCRLFCFPIAPVLEVVGGQVWTEIADSSDSVTDTEERFRFVGINATDAFVATFRFGLLGGSAITMLVLGIPLAPRNHYLIRWVALAVLLTVVY